MCAIASGALHTATTTTFYVVQVASVVYVVVYYLHDNLYNINNNLCCAGCRPHNKHDNQNNGDNKLCCTGCSCCRPYNKHDNQNNGDNILCCTSCLSCRPKIITRQPKQQEQHSLLYKLFELSSLKYNTTTKTTRTTFFVV